MPLSKSEVHLWYCRTERFAAQTERMLGYLDAGERQRYERFLNPTKQEQFVIGRALLKQRLADYLACSAEHIRFRYTPQSKPYLEDDLAFNLSHSGPHLLMGVARRAVGVDVQEETSIRREHVLAGLSQEERQRVRPDGLFCYWVLKEAWWKADNHLTNAAPLLDALSNLPLGAQFTGSVGQWHVGYRKNAGVHLGWVVDHPRPVWHWNGQLLNLRSY